MPVELGRKDGIWDDVQLQVQIFRYLSSNKHLNFIRLRANSTQQYRLQSRAAAAPKGKKRKEDEGGKGGGRGRALLTQSASSSSATNSATIAFDDASAQPASQPARGRGSAGGEERGRAAEVRSRKERGFGGDGRTNGREEGKSERRRRRRRWGTERTHLLSPPLLAVLCSASQTSSVTPPLLLYFCSIFRVLAEWGPGKGSDGRASGRTRERTSGRGRNEGGRGARSPTRAQQSTTAAKNFGSKTSGADGRRLLPEADRPRAGPRVPQGPPRPARAGLEHGRSRRSHGRRPQPASGELVPASN